MKKSRIMALLIAVVMVMSFLPTVYAATDSTYMVGDDGTVFVKSDNLISNPSFESGALTGSITELADTYEVTSEDAYDGNYSLKAIQSTSTSNGTAIVKNITVSDASHSYYLSFWYKNVDETSARRPRVTFSFADGSGTLPTDEDFIDETGSWVNAGTASNDMDMEYSNGEWVQYSTIITGNGDATECAQVKLQIYGLKADASYLDDFELYELTPSSSYSSEFKTAVAAWENVTMPSGPLAGAGVLSLPTATTSSNISVKWSSTNSERINPETGVYTSGTEDEVVILTATLYEKNYESEIYKEFEYPYVVKSMFEEYAEWVSEQMDSIFGSAISESVTGLPTEHSIEGYPDATISWSSDDPDVFASDGTFTAPEVTKYINIIATITCEGSTYDVTKRVKALGGNLVADGLVMYYDFETSATKGTISDKSGNGNDATIMSGLTINDGYANFSGSDSTIVLPSNYGTLLTGSYSVSMWVYVSEDIANSSAMYRFFDFGGGTTTSQFLRYIPYTGQLSFMDRGTSGGSDTWAINTTLTGIAGTWTLLTFTYDYHSSYSNVILYVNGEEYASATNSTLTNSIYNVTGTTSTTGYIGKTQWNNTDNPDFIGMMDDVRIYNRVLDDDEIVTLYDETIPVETAVVTIKYLDREGNRIKDDVTVSAEVDTTYDVPDSLKTIASDSEGESIVAYSLVASKSYDSVYVTSDGDNTCTLVYDITTATLGDNIIENGDFATGDATGWTNRLGTTITGYTIEYDDEVGGYALSLDTGGKTATNNIGTIWTVEKGKTYLLSFMAYADSISSSNYDYNRVSDAYNTTSDGNYENSGNDLVTWGADITQGVWNSMSTTFTATTNVVYFQSSWATGVKIANVSLRAFVEEGDSGDEEDDSREVIIRYLDTDGNKLEEDTVVSVESGVNTYTVSDSDIAKATVIKDGVLTMYEYVEDKSTPTVSVSMLRDNICELVYEVTTLYVADNLVENNSFIDESGNFTMGTWQSPQGNGYFDNISSSYFYVVDANGSATLYSAGATHSGSDDYALGTRWNDGESGLCSLANFIPVEAGNTYYVAYDYKHQSAGTNANYIRTTFQKSNASFTPSDSSNNHTPSSVTTSWQTNEFFITAEEDGYIYFHFSWLGSGGSSDTSSNSGSGPYWYFDDFYVMQLLDEPAERVNVTIKYQDADGNTLADDATVNVAITGGTYAVPSSYKTLDTIFANGYSYTYTYNEELSTDEITLSTDGNNVCILVFDVTETDLSGNIITNPSFEDGVTGWTTTNYTKQIVDGDDGFSLVADATDGEYALMITTYTGSSNAGALSTKWAIEGGLNYQLSFDIKTAAGDPTGFVELLDESSTSLGHIAGEMPGEVWSGTGEYVPASDEWSTVTYTFSTTEDTKYIGLKLAWASEDYPIYVDNFKLVQVSVLSNQITYADGVASIVVVEDATGYLVQATYDEEGALTKVVISDLLQLTADAVTTVEVEEGAKLMLIESLATMKPLAAAITAE